MKNEIISKYRSGVERIPVKGRRPLYIISVMIIFFVIVGIIYYNLSSGPADHTEPEIQHYTCPMHPQIQEDNPGTCPICHMDLVPVRESSSSEDEEQDRHIDVSTARQQMIGVRTIAAERKETGFELRTTGRIAYDPELAVAIQEYLMVRRDPSLRQSAVSRLRLKGMGDDEIQTLHLRPGAYDSLHNPGHGRSVWIYAPLYEGEEHLVKAGQEATVSLPSGEELTGIVRSLSPVVDPVTRSVDARIEVQRNDQHLRPDSFVNISIQIDLGESLVVPRSAVVDTGDQQIVFVVKHDRHFYPRHITTGGQSGDYTIVTGGLEEGENVVYRATFLIDSESRLQNIITDFEERPQEQTESEPDNRVDREHQNHNH